MLENEDAVIDIFSHKPVGSPADEKLPIQYVSVLGYEAVF